MQLFFRLDNDLARRPGESHLALDGKKTGLCLGPVGSSGPKSGTSQENFAAARRCFASRFADEYER